MTSALLALAIAQTRTVTFSHPCARSAVVLEALGKELGVRMQPGGSVARDFVVLHLDAVPVDEAVKKIAEALNATWTQQGVVHVLTRTPAQENKERQDALAADTKLVQDWLDKRKVEGQVTLEGSLQLIESVLPLLKQNPNGTFDEQAWQRQRELDQKGPTQRCLSRILNEIGAAAIASIPEGERVQYVVNPTPKQRQLPNGQALRLYTVENEIFKEAIRRSGALDRLQGDGMMYSALIHPYQEGMSRYEETVLTINRQHGTWMVRFELEGGGQASEGISLDREQPAGVPQELLQQQGDYVPTALETELGNIARVVFGGQGERASVSSEAVAVLSDPVANEPLTVFGSRWMIEAAKALKKNLIGVVSDEAYLASMFIVSQGMKGFGSFWKFIPQVAGSGYSIGLEDKWLTLYPNAPLAVRDARLDRDAWKRALARGKPGGSAGLDEYAAFAALSDHEMAVMISCLPAMFLEHGIQIDELSRDGNIDALRIYGRLTMLQQRAARNGGAELLLSRAPSTMSLPISRLVFKQGSLIVSDRKPIGWGDTENYYMEGTQGDPLRTLPRGYPPASVMRVYVIRQNVYHQQRDERVIAQRGSTAEQIGQMIASAEVWPEQHRFLRPMFAVAPAEQLLIEFEFTNVGFMYHRVQMDTAQSALEYKALKDLPEADRAAIEAATKKYREMYKNIKRGDGGG